MRKIIILLIAFIFILSIGYCEENKENSKVKKITKKSKKKKKRKMFVYKPKKEIGAPLVREGAASRGMKGNLVLSTIVPDHIGFSASSSPVVYWFISEIPNNKLNFTLSLDPDDIDEDSDTLIDTSIKCSKSGIIGINLKDYKVKLKEGKRYKWSVEEELSEDFSGDNSAEGTIVFKKPDKKLRKVINKSDDFDLVGVYAQNGYWYDAFSTISKLIKENPKDKELVKYRNSFIEQVGLIKTLKLLRK